MLRTDSRSSAVRSISLLVIEANETHQGLLIDSLRLALEVNVQIVATADEALMHLHRCEAEYVDFPQLVLMDPHLPDAPTGWQLLETIRADYPQLPVVVVSHDQQPATVLRAYRSGAHSFVAKPSQPNEWKLRFGELMTYWLQTVTLPNRPSIL